MTLSSKLNTPWQPLRASSISLVDQLVEHLGTRIRNHGLRSGTRLPSVRSLADETGLSRFTVVQAYDRLVAQGIIQSRRGSGFYVSPPAPSPMPATASRPSLAPDAAFDTAFLLRSMFREDALPNLPGSAGLLPPSWMDHEMVAAAIRTVGRSIGRSLVSYGVPKGLKALRQQIALTLHAQDVPAHPDMHLMTVAGVTHGLDLISRTFIRPGDTVFVEDPGWFLIFGRLTALGAKVVGIPRLADGPDTQALAHLAERHHPKLFITNTAVHNPTGHTLSAGVAYEILRIAERFNFLLVEDDTYADFHPASPVRLAALDRLNRVLLVGGYSKTLAASLRVGYVAGAPALIDQLADTKLLGALTTPELGEQVLYRILAEGHYRRHVERLRTRVDHARDQCIKMLLQAGCSVPHEPHAGMFVWADCGMDTEVLARRAAATGVLFAPGVLFSPVQAPSSRFRLAVSMVDDPKGWQTLEALLKQAQSGTQYRQTTQLV